MNEGLGIAAATYAKPKVIVVNVGLLENNALTCLQAGPNKIPSRQCHARAKNDSRDWRPFGVKLVAFWCGHTPLALIPPARSFSSPEHLKRQGPSLRRQVRKSDARHTPLIDNPCRLTLQPCASLGRVLDAESSVLLGVVRPHENACRIFGVAANADLSCNPAQAITELLKLGPIFFIRLPSRRRKVSGRPCKFRFQAQAA